MAWYDPVGYVKGVAKDATSAVTTWVWNSQGMKYVLVAGGVCAAVKYGPATVKAISDYQESKLNKELMREQIRKEKLGFLEGAFDIAHATQIGAIERSLAKNGCYVHRREELAIFKALDEALFGIEPFGIVIYGPKGVGKTYMMKRILYHFAGKTPNGKFKDVYMHGDDNEEKGYNEDMARVKQYFDKGPTYPLHVVFVNCNLAEAKSSNDIKKLIANAIIKEKDGSQFAGTFEQVLRNNVKIANKIGQKVVIYCHVTKVNDAAAFGQLVNCARDLAETEGIAVLMEVSKPYLFANNEVNRMRVRKVKVSPLSKHSTLGMMTELFNQRRNQSEKKNQNDESRNFLNLINNSASKPTTTVGQDTVDELPTADAVFEQTGGLPQLIFWAVTTQLQLEILAKKEELRERLIERGDASTEAQYLYDALQGAVIHANAARAQILIDLAAVDDVDVGRLKMKDPIVKQAVMLLQQEGFEVN